MNVQIFDIMPVSWRLYSQIVIFCLLLAMGVYFVANRGKRRLHRVSPCNRRFGRTASGLYRMHSLCKLYFLPLGASIMFIFLPSSLGIISTLATSSRSVAKRSSRISPCSLKTIERPRKKT